MALVDDKLAFNLSLTDEVKAKQTALRDYLRSLDNPGQQQKDLIAQQIADLNTYLMQNLLTIDASEWVRSHWGNRPARSLRPV